LVINAAPSIGGAGLGMGMGFRNRIINGAMVIDQRNAGASVSDITGVGAYPVDRFNFRIPAAIGGTFSVQRVADAPAGFVYSAKLTVTAAATVGSTNRCGIAQGIEGFNLADLAYGTASASPVTLSFWVKSSIAGTYCCALRDRTITGVANLSYVANYTVAQADTWEYKTITIPGYTAGTISTDNSLGLAVCWDIGSGTSYDTTPNVWIASDEMGTAGAVSVIENTGATFQITGVQLEKGSTATVFDHRSYTTELQLCQRYAIVYGRDQSYNEIGGTGFAYSTTKTNIPVSMPVQMRSTPTIANSGNLQASDGAAATALTAISIITQQSSSLIASLEGTAASGLTAYRPYRIETNNSTTAYVLLSAEL
jgi:hypothetical protein